MEQSPHTPDPQKNCPSMGLREGTQRAHFPTPRCPVYHQHPEQYAPDCAPTPAGEISSAGRGVPGRIYALSGACQKKTGRWPGPSGKHMPAMCCISVCARTCLCASLGVGGAGWGLLKKNAALAGGCQKKTGRWPAPALAGVRVYCGTCPFFGVAHSRIKKISSDSSSSGVWMMLRV